MGAQLRMAGGSVNRRGRARARPMSEINVTPFVDVMLVLLIIFMVAAPLLTVGVPLKLPETSAPPMPQEKEEPLTVNIDADGRVYIQKTEIGTADLLAKLTAIAAERETKNVYLRADASLDYGFVARVLADLKGAGFTSIGMINDQPKGGTGQ